MAVYPVLRVAVYTGDLIKEVLCGIENLLFSAAKQRMPSLVLALFFTLDRRSVRDLVVSWYPSRFS